MDTLTNSQTGSAPDRLPRGSALPLETILDLSRQIRDVEDLTDAKSLAAAIEANAAELVEKMRRQMGVAA